MSTWNHDPVSDAILAERERQVTRFLAEVQVKRAARSQSAGTTQRGYSLASLRHRLAVVFHLAQEQPSAPTA